MANKPALEQRINEMMEQARVLEAHLNEIIAREASLSIDF